MIFEVYSVYRSGQIIATTYQLVSQISVNLSKENFKSFAELMSFLLGTGVKISR